MENNVLGWLVNWLIDLILYSRKRSDADEG